MRHENKKLQIDHSRIPKVIYDDPEKGLNQSDKKIVYLNHNYKIF